MLEAAPPGAPEQSHALIVVAAAVLPLIFLLVLTFAEWLVDAKPFWNVAVQIGWDMCILGVGLAAGLFSDPRFVQDVGGQIAVFATSAVLGCDLVFAFIILAVKKHQKFTRGWGTSAVILGVLAVSIPCVLLISEGKI